MRNMSSHFFTYFISSCSSADLILKSPTGKFNASLDAVVEVLIRLVGVCDFRKCHWRPFRSVLSNLFWEDIRRCM